MKVTFRQGMIRRQTNLSAPDFLRKTSLSGTSIDLIVSPEPTIVTLVHYGANYLIEEVRTKVAAWGGGTDPGSGVNNDELVATGQTQYLYWDIDLATAQIRRGWTNSPPFINPIAPISPVNDLHWFDTSDIEKPILKVWRVTGNNGKWVEKVRCFAAIYTSSAIITPYPIGSQIGITAPTGYFYNTGPILLGVNNKPLRQSDGTFATTETQLIVQQTAGQNIKFETALTYAQAGEEIPKFHCVSMRPHGRIGLTRNTDIYNACSGVVIEDLHQEEVGQVISNGLIRNEQWSWTPAQINKPLFVGTTGELTLLRPGAGFVQQIGYVYDTDAIYVNLFPPVRLR